MQRSSPPVSGAEAGRRAQARRVMNAGPHRPVRCWVYRSSRKDEMYLYLPQKDAFDGLPEALLRSLGRLDLVMELELTPRRALARADVLRVLEDLAARGFYLQMPPTLNPEMYYGE